MHTKFGKNRKYLMLLLLAGLSLAGCGKKIDDSHLVATKIHQVKSADKLNKLIADSNKNRSNAFTSSGPVTDAVPAPESGTADMTTSRDFIDTNVQVTGVGEADIIKTDGYDIYYIAPYTNRFYVFTVDDDFNIRVKHDLTTADVYFEDMYLLDDYVVTFGRQYTYFYNAYSTPEISIMPWGVTTKSVIQVYDRLTMDVVYSLASDVHFFHHRLIDRSLFLVGHKYLYEDTTEPRPAYAENDDDTAFIDYDDIYYYDDTLVNGMTVIGGLYLHSDPNEINYNAEGYLGAGYSYKQIYATTENLYVTDSNYFYGRSSSFQTMTISQFALNINDATSSFVAAGIVKGAMLNQFSLDEHNGYLRVATTNMGASWRMLFPNTIMWESFETHVTNYLFILKVNKAASGFTLVSQISEGLGKPNETIRSVRFNGDVAYIVTFLQTDPLYVIDLSDPEHPAITDAIFLPGFDTYQHPWGDNLLIGFGHNATENGVINGLKVSAYDVTMGAAHEIQTMILGTEQDSTPFMRYEYSYSEASYNHKAFLVSPSHNLFGFPFARSSYSDFGYDHYSAFYLLRIDFSSATPLSEPIKISHPQVENAYTHVQRAIYIENFVYTFSNNYVVVYDLVNDVTLDTMLTF